jgi:hypothetical protein
VLKGLVQQQLTTEASATPVAPIGTNAGPSPSGPAGRPFRESAPPPAHNSTNGRNNGSAPPRGGDRGDDRQADRPPTDGRQLYAWLKRQEETEGVDLIRAVSGWARR